MIYLLFFDIVSAELFQKYAFTWRSNINYFAQ